MKKYCFMILMSLCVLAQAQYSTKDIYAYIDKYHSLATEKMKSFGIPASITLAQGILESGAGTSELAVNANNHFGIKCHSNWKGEVYHKDDDRKNECFRKYPSAEQSFDDHSAFLKRPRYEKLFSLKITDYKSWAKGLKECGYATNPQYAEKLITLIEKYELYKYDTQSAIAKKEKNNTESLQTPKPASPTQNTTTLNNTTFSPVDYPYTANRDVFMNNDAYFVIAKEGDSFYQIAIDVQLTIGQLRKYNDVPNRKYEPKNGEIVYLSSKKRYSSTEKEHVVKENETLRDISQQYGCKEKSLQELNRLTKTDILKAGQKIKLKH